MTTKATSEEKPSQKKTRRRGGRPARTKRVVVRTSRELGALVRLARLRLDMNQTEAAICCGVGRRFFIELENGKPTLQLDKVFRVLDMLGLNLALGGPGTAFTAEELARACLKRAPDEPEHVWEAEFSKSMEAPYCAEPDDQPRRGRRMGQLGRQWDDEVNLIKTPDGTILGPDGEPVENADVAA